MVIGRHSRRMSYSNREESFFPTASVRGAEGPSCMTGFSAGFAASSCQPLSFLSGGQHDPWLYDTQGPRRHLVGAVI